VGAVHAVKAVIPDRGFPAGQFCGLGQIEQIGVRTLGDKVQNPADLPAAHHQHIGARQTGVIRDGEPVVITDGAAPIDGNTGVAGQAHIRLKMQMHP